MKKVLAGIMSCLLLVSACACGGGEGKRTLVYPDFPETPAQGESWEYIDPNEEITLRWFINYRGSSDFTTRIAKEVKERLGVDIQFTFDDGTGQKMNLIMNGKQKYDIISVQAWQPQASLLAMQNYIFPIDELSKRWAPNLLSKIGSDLRNYYEMADGYIYGLPSSSYSEEDMEEGQKYDSNGALLVRKDWLEEYFAAAGWTTDAQKEQITTKDGLKAAMNWVKSNKPASSGGQTLSPLLIDAFTLEGNNSVLWLSQFFAAPWEDAEGNWQDVRTTSQYKEALAYLNECRREGLINDFYTTTGPIEQIIRAGQAFAVLGTPQLYTSSFEYAYENGVEYIPIAIRNDAGDAPVLQDMTGYGYMYNMIMYTCERPDIVIKLFDFLYSEEGQYLTTFGIEGVHWNWDETKTRIEWTQEYLDGKIADEGYAFSQGIGRLDMFERPAVTDKVKPQNGLFAEEAYSANLKWPMACWSYSFSIGRPNLDSSASDFRQIINIYSAVEGAWQSRLLTMLEQRSAEAFEAYYDNVMQTLEKAGMARLEQSFNTVFQRNKRAQGLEFAYPALRADYGEGPALADGGKIPFYGDLSYRTEYEILEKN